MTSTTTRIPQPRRLPVLGNVHQLDPNAAIVRLGDLADQYGPLFRLDIVGYDLLVATSQAIVNELCDQKRFDKAIFASLQELRGIAGDALFTAETNEPNWAAAHRILMPTFGPVGLESMFDGMMDISEQLLVKWERLGPDHVIDVTDTLTRLTLDTIALCSFSYRFNSMYSDAEHPFIESLLRMLIEAEARYRRPPGVSRLLMHKARRFEADKAYIYRLAEQMIDERLRHPNPEDRQDILDRMLTTVDSVTGETLPRLNVRNQLITFLVAGHETTSGMLSFTMYALLKNPDVLAKARAEVDEVLGGRRPRFEDVARLPYLDAMLKESLRLWPTATAFSVKPLQDTTVGGFEVRKDQHIVVPMFNLHRDPAVWENPERFDPERFLFERARHIAPNAWKPFGNGQRSCIGRGFAIQESILFLATLLQRFTPVLDNPNYELDVVQTLTIKPGGLYMRLLPRTDGPQPVDAPPATTSSRGAQPQPVTAKTGTGIAMQVLYGSEGGTSKGFAERIVADAAARGFDATLSTLDAAVGDLRQGGLTMIVCCSYEGEPPEGAKNFVSWLQSKAEADLGGVNFAVFGCGNTDWARTYQAIPIAIDADLERLGATRLVERGEANARADFFGDFDNWYTGFWDAVHNGLGITAPESALAPAAVQLEFVESARDTQLARHGLAMATVLESRALVDMSKPGARAKHHVELALPADMSYAAGDYLLVLPRNPAALVDRALRRLGLHAEATVVLHNCGAGSIGVPAGTPVTVSDLFTNWVELAKPAGRAAIVALAEKTPCARTAETLRAMSEPGRYQADVFPTRVSVLDLLERYPACMPGLDDLLSILPPLTPRQYSISSSPRAGTDRVSVTAAVVRVPALSGSGRYEGVASTFLERCLPGDQVPVALKASAHAFAPPPVTTPVVMVCAGSGLAPFRGFLQDRALQAADEGIAPAPALLFFGCDAPDVDLLYSDELEKLTVAGIVDLRPAFSATPENGMPFVQDRLWADRADVVELFATGATVFVCGEGQYMAPAVRETCARIYAEATGSDPSQASVWMDRMEAIEKRYVADVFA